MGLRRGSNFASRGRRPVRAVSGVLWALAFSTAALLFVALGDVVRLRDEVAQTRDYNARLVVQVADLTDKATDAPDVAALRFQSQRVEFYNDLTGSRQLPVTGLLALLEDQLPQGVWINQLNYNEENGRLSLSIRTDKEATLPLALRTLEGQETLQDLILERQLRLTQGGRQLAQYDIEAVAR